MKASYKYIALALAALLCSCNEEITPDVNESQVQISANITPCVLTRVTEDGKSFTDGDVIKVQNTDRENKNLATYTYSESTGKWSASEDLYWEGTSSNIFHAWHPSTAAYGSFTIPADQTSGTAEADWMTATASAKKADGAVNLSFNHNLAKVTVTIDSWSNEYAENEKVANSLELNSLSGEMFNDGTLSGDNTAKWVKAFVAQVNTSFVAIIAPGTYASGDNIMQIYVNGSATPLAVKTSSALAIESGKAYRFKLSVGKDLAEITSDVTVDAWDDETLDDQQARPVIKQTTEYIDEYGINHGEGIEIDGIVWAPVNCGYHATDYKYGKLYQWGRKYGQGYDSNDASIPSIVRGPEDFFTAQKESNSNKFYSSMNSDFDWIYGGSNSYLWNSGTEDNPIKTEYDPCPEGWRVPTRSELDALKANYSSWTTNNGQNGYWFSGSKPYSESTNSIFLSAAGHRLCGDGNASNRGDDGKYWSSSPNNNDTYYLSFYASNVLITYYHRATGCSVRCVREDSALEAPEPVNLSKEGTANSYIVSSSGAYKFSTVKGNSSESVGAVASAEVLWETFGTDKTPNVGDLVKNVSYSDGYITFQTADTFKEGNAVIAAKDASGKILWSWHVWLTDEPEGQEYYNNAGTMMDRNLGATSATPGDVGALGLLYQWGRKDPFLGSSSISEPIDAKSTITWPSSSWGGTTTIAYATANPTTFIEYYSENSDWYHSNSSSNDNTRWTESSNDKSIYDPCPTGWRVPDGGSNGVWSKALDSSLVLDYTYDNANEGINFSSKFGSASTIWYPASIYRHSTDGSLFDFDGGRYWSASPHKSFSGRVCILQFDNEGSVSSSGSLARAIALPVRCQSEGTIISKYIGLSASGTANSYIVSEAGSYKFTPTKGNSSKSVGTIASVETLWESFGTDVTPNVGDIVKNVTYADGVISFETPEIFKEGNAVIAAKDASGTILWSWHIWLTDEPEKQKYYGNAGTMMDRNLGAISATPGDVGALGLLYQWGRKDPFLGSSSISESVEAKSTITWPLMVESNSSNGTISYATNNPTTFITGDDSNNDWYYTDSSSTDDTRWTTSLNTKSIYDPCPVGWRVPDGGDTGVWDKSVGSYKKLICSYDSTHEGSDLDFFGSASTIWYPASGCLSSTDGSLYDVGNAGFYWSASSNSNSPYSMHFNYLGSINLHSLSNCAYGRSVRCIQEVSLD